MRQQVQQPSLWSREPQIVRLAFALGVAGFFVIGAAVAPFGMRFSGGLVVIPGLPLHPGLLFQEGHKQWSLGRSEVSPPIDS